MILMLFVVKDGITIEISDFMNLMDRALCIF